MHNAVYLFVCIALITFTFSRMLFNRVLLLLWLSGMCEIIYDKQKLAGSLPSQAIKSEKIDMKGSNFSSFM